MHGHAWAYFVRFVYSGNVHSMSMFLNIKSNLVHYCIKNIKHTEIVGTSNEIKLLNEYINSYAVIF